MKRVKILQLINSHDIGGAEIMLLTLLDGLDRARYDATVCIIGDSPLRVKVAQRGFATSQLPPYRGRYDLRFLRHLVGEVRRHAPHLIQSHIWHTNYYASLCGALLRIPVVSTFHSNHAIETFPERVSLRLILWCSSKVVLVSPYQLRHYNFPQDPHKLAVIHNGISFPDLGAPPFSGVPKREGGERVLITVGNLRPVKGHTYLLRALQRLVGKGEDVRLMIVGEGPLREDLGREASELGIAERVSFCGYRDDVLHLLHGSDVFVSSSLSEATSIAVIEAMAMAKPVVATAVGGSTQLIDDGVDGFLVPSCSPEAIAEKVLFLLKDGEAAAAVGRRARAKVERSYSIEGMVREYQNLYEDLAPARHAAAGG